LHTDCSVPSPRDLPAEGRWIMAEKTFTQSQLRAIADALADTNEGLSGSEIGHMLATCHTDDPTPTLTKRHRLYNAFAAKQNLAQIAVPFLSSSARR
jgi:hypothetical protein